MYSFLTVYIFHGSSLINCIFIGELSPLVRKYTYFCNGDCTESKVILEYFQQKFLPSRFAFKNKFKNTYKINSIYKCFFK